MEQFGQGSTKSIEWHTITRGPAVVEHFSVASVQCDDIYVRGICDQSVSLHLGSVPFPIVSLG